VQSAPWLSHLGFQQMMSNYRTVASKFTALAARKTRRRARKLLEGLRPQFPRRIGPSAISPTNSRTDRGRFAIGTPRKTWIAGNGLCQAINQNKIGLISDGTIRFAWSRCRGRLNQRWNDLTAIYRRRPQHIRQSSDAWGQRKHHSK
jgi:hypothetical protein